MKLSMVREESNTCAKKLILILSSVAGKRKSTQETLTQTILSYLPQIKNKNFIIFLCVIILGFIALFFFKRDLFVAATVDGNPITNYELQNRLNQDFRKQSLDQLINEQIVENEAGKNNVKVSSQEVLDKIKEYEQKYGGQDSFDSILEQRGTTREALKGVMRTQLYLEKLYSSQATVSSQEIDDYIKTNKATLVATQEAEQKLEAEKNIKEQKLFKIFSEKFQELKEKAKVEIY